MTMKSVFICVFQVCMRKYLREIWVLLHLTGECHIRGSPDCLWSLHSKVIPSCRLLLLHLMCLYEICSIPTPTVDHILMYFACVQFARQVQQGDAVCLDDTMFTRLMGFYMSFPETAATYSLGTATIAPSHCWVSHTQTIQ